MQSLHGSNGSNQGQKLLRYWLRRLHIARTGSAKSFTIQCVHAREYIVAQCTKAPLRLWMRMHACLVARRTRHVSIRHENPQTVKNPNGNAWRLSSQLSAFFRLLLNVNWIPVESVVVSGGWSLKDLNRLKSERVIYNDTLCHHHCGESGTVRSALRPSHHHHTSTVRIVDTWSLGLSAKKKRRHKKPTFTSHFCSCQGPRQQSRQKAATR